MATRYDIRISNTDGSLGAALTAWRALQYTRTLRGIDSLALQLDGKLPAGSGRNTTAASLFATDARIEVYREDRAAVTRIPRYRDADMLFRTPIDQVQSDGTATYTAQAVGLNDLLARRTIRWPEGSAQTDKSGPAESVMLAYVNENAGPGATVAAGRITDGVIAGLQLAPDGGRGMVWTGSRAWRPLFDVLQEISVAAHLDFGVVRTDASGSGPAAFLFAVRPYWGVDRSTAGLSQATGRNAAGNVPVVFALGFGNMGAPFYTLNRTAEANSILMLGQGSPGSRATAEVTDGAAIVASPWNRREANQSASTEDTAGGLLTAGASRLALMAARESFSFTVLQTDACRLGREYDLGDLITARYQDVERNFQITEISMSVHDDVEEIGIVVANVP